MAPYGGDSDGNKNEPPTLLTIPQELRDKILVEALHKDGTVLLDGNCDQQNNKSEEYSWPWKGSRDVKHCYYSLALTCKQLHTEATPIFFKSNTFELWVCGMTLALSDRWCRLITDFDIHVVFVTGRSYSSHLIACIQVRGATVIMKVAEKSNKTWSILEDGTEEVTGTSEHPHHTDNMFERLKPSWKMLHKAVQGGQGVGIDTLKRIQRKMDRAS